MAVVSMKSLLETGVHFGHRTRKWNPRMKPFIFTERNGIHIVDLQQTLEAIEIAYGVVRDNIADGGSILFVGTKRQAQDTIEVEAARCGMPYVNWRWLGGTLTNWRTIRSRIDELKGLERRREEGEFDLLPKKERLMLQRKIERLQERLGGIRDMRDLPKLLFLVDVRREETAVHEANLLDIPVIALVDTNCDPTTIDYVIPSNDDAIRAIKLLTTKIADAVLEGMAMRKEEDEELVEAEAEVLAGVEMTDEELLGEATLAKLQTGEYDEKEEPAAEAEPAVTEDETAEQEPVVEEPAGEEPDEAVKEETAAPEEDESGDSVVEAVDADEGEVE